ncbi:heavy-metal-associated domain-containing protein [Spirillospora sp. NPDC048911]|uniref:heavy-metal-associated domain-containing protein n=1 Tax=Spirillospora sp. NPDC048911 TaxID=3364527 RepID=UPI003713E44D
MTVAAFAVSGMSCGHCASAVTEEVSQLAGIQQVDVDVAGGSVRISANGPIDEGDVRAAIEEAGYEVVGLTRRIRPPGRRITPPGNRSRTGSRSTKRPSGSGDRPQPSRSES